MTVAQCFTISGLPIYGLELAFQTLFLSASEGMRINDSTARTETEPKPRPGPRIDGSPVTEDVA